MRTALAALLSLLTAAPATAQTWSPPQSLSGVKPLIDSPGLTFSRDGRGLASWSYVDDEVGRSNSGASSASIAPGAAAFGAERTLLPRAPIESAAQVVGPVAYGRDGALVAVRGAKKLAVRSGHTNGSFGRSRTIASGARIGGAELAANGNGDAALAWFEDRGTRTDRVYVALRRAHHAFGTPRRLATGRIRDVAVAVGASGDVLVVWNSPGKVLTRFKPRTRSSFRAVERIRSKPAYFTVLAPVVTGNGRAAVAWSSQFASEGGGLGPIRFQVAFRPAGADRFKAARLLETLPATGTSREIDAVEGATQRIAIAWSGSDGATRRVKVARFDDGFTAPRLASPPGVDAHLTDLAADVAQGTLLAVWDGGVDAPPSLAAALSDGLGGPFGAPEAIAAGRNGAAAFEPRTHRPTVVFSDDRAVAMAATRSG